MELGKRGRFVKVSTRGATPVKWALPFTPVNFTGQAGLDGN